MKGIDVAKWNGIIDWKKAKEAGVEFAILKIIDKQCKIEDAFERNYAGAVGQGIPVDVYNYSYATTIQKATQDANTVVAAARGKEINYVWLDIEDKCQMNLGITLIDMINAYQSIIEGTGLKFGVYTGLSFYNTYIKPFHGFVHCPFWIARYPSGAVMDLNMDPLESKKPVIMHDLWGWQYTSKGRINGISGNVDLNIKYDSKAAGNGTEQIKIESECRTVKKGSKGADVKYLQEYLLDKGYYIGSIDSVFGSMLEKAVILFQYDTGLVPDGIVGTKTWEMVGKNPELKVKVFSYAKDRDRKISANFSAKEFQCKDKSDRILIDTDFVQDKLQKIRDHFGTAITVNSGFRTIPYNTSVGGASSSYHLYGRAFDIVVKGHTPLEVAQYAQSIGINGIIQYNSFVHVDSRETKYWARNNNGKDTKVNSF